MEIRKLNMLRGIAALIVVTSHYSNHSNLLGGVLGSGGGQFGVMLFFMLSGFLMSYLYLHQRPAGSRLCHYAAARFARVVPLYVAVVLVSWLLIQLGISDALYPIPGWKALLTHLLMLRGVSVLWTIPPEIQFYVLFAGLWWLWGQRPGILYLLLGATFLLLWSQGFPRPTGSVLGLPWDFSLAQALPYFSAGMLYGSLYGKLNLPGRAVRHGNVCVLLLIPLLYPLIFTALTGDSHGMWQDPTILLALSLVFFITVFAVPDDNPLLVNRVGDFLGRISYSLYLWHLPILLAVKPLAAAYPWWSLGPYLLLSIAAAQLSFQVIEDPSRRYLRRVLMRGS
jgi:peptidoglycan/LPS O-acetylase OafA/YrhL